MNIHKPGAGQLLSDLLAVEIGAGRLEGTFLADPELGRMWRAQMGEYRKVWGS